MTHDGKDASECAVKALAVNCTVVPERKLSNYKGGLHNIAMQQLINAYPVLKKTAVSEFIETELEE